MYNLYYINLDDLCNINYCLPNEIIYNVLRKEVLILNNNTQFLNKIITVKIDRPMGSKHSEKYPNHVYPINYGYVPGTISGDGKELDVYVLGTYEPLETFTGKCIAIIHRIDDNDDKLIVVPENRYFSNAQIRALTEFQERFFKSKIIK